MIDAEPRRTFRFLNYGVFFYKVIESAVKISQAIKHFFKNKIYHFVLYYMDSFFNKMLTSN